MGNNQKLKITKTKAENLIYEYHQRTSLEEKELVKTILTNSPIQFEKQSKENIICILVVQDKYTRDCIRNILTQAKEFSDCSFASENIRISLEGFEYLLKNYNLELWNSYSSEKIKNLLIDATADILSKWTGKTVGDLFKKIF